MQILVSRHGNTFGPGDAVVWTGATNDLPLVDKGFEQARALGNLLKSAGVTPSAIYAGPLKRTLDYAKTVAEMLHAADKVRVDHRLLEVDYGDWTGRTNSEVAAKYGETALKDWDERSVWPEGAGWTGSPEELTARVRAFADQLTRDHSPSDTVLVVSSNGTMRYFLTLCEGELERRVRDGSFKTKTGHLGKLVSENGRYAVAYWNKAPHEFKGHL